MVSSITRKLREDFVEKVWRTGGFVVNTNIKKGRQYYNQSGSGACIFGLASAMKGIHLGEEMWLQDTVYALSEDMLLYYKLYLDRNRIAINMDVSFFHLDAGATLVNTDKYINNIYALARNGVIFWHRFIYLCGDKRWLSSRCFARRIFCSSFFALLKGIKKADFKIFKTYLKTYTNGFNYIRSDKYRQLNKVLYKRTILFRGNLSSLAPVV